LFAAQRIGNAKAAISFLRLGEECLHHQVSALRRAFFERGRSIYLIENDRAAEALELVNQTIDCVGTRTGARISVLLSIASALCEWALGNRQVARRRLVEHYAESKRSRLYHHFVLQALVKVYSDASDQEGVACGLAYAKELVEYTTSVKKAKFYRQLRKQGAADLGTVDPFAASKEWLDLTASLVGNGTRTNNGLLASHEELTAIHDDMARLRLAGLRREIRTDAVDTAENWAIAAEFFDDETGFHCYRVGHLASLLARKVGMDDTFCVQIEHAARLHDIGKIAVNEVILLKPGPLDAAEMAAMRLHTEVGAQILSGSDDATLQMATEVARHHHEWWNGGGYPRRLIGRDIPLSARISAYADVYDALTHARAYKAAWTHERALAEITRLAGSQFDPDLLEPFCDVLERYLEDLRGGAIPGYADMNSNSLVSSRKKLMETIAATG